LQEKSARLALLNADLNIDGDGGFDVVNDSQEQNESELENSEDGRDDDGDDTRSEVPRQSYTLTNPGMTFTYGGESAATSATNRNAEPRTGTYGKAKPSILDGIRNFDSGRFNNAPKPPSEQRGATERD
jgi:hypothetical protein